MRLRTPGGRLAPTSVICANSSSTGIDGFDREAWEAALGELPRFRVGVERVGIHFVHANAVAAGNAMPLVLSHGWPDSFWRFSKVIPMLTDPEAYGDDPADAFDVVVLAVHRTDPGLPAFDTRLRCGSSFGRIGGACSGWSAALHPARAIISTLLPLCKGGKDALTKRKECEGASDRGAGRGLFGRWVGWVRPFALGRPRVAARAEGRDWGLLGGSRR